MHPDQNLCPDCRIFKEICLCEHIQRIALKTRFTLFAHVKEIKRITNTGRLALYSLVNSQVVLRGDRNSVYQASELVPDEYHSILLTPNAPIVLNESLIQSISKPINLIIPDGTWQQVRRMVNSEQKLHRILHVRLPDKFIDFATLRKVPQDNFLPTLSAIAHALGIIENKEIKDYFESLLEIMTARLKKRLHRKNKNASLN